MICANPDSQVSAAMRTIMELPILMAFARFLYPSTETSSTGGNQQMPIVNKYTACYMWKRTG